MAGKAGFFRVGDEWGGEASGIEEGVVYLAVELLDLAFHAAGGVADLVEHRSE